MKILLTGSQGQVGWEITRKISKWDLEIASTHRQILDICDLDAIRDVLNADHFDMIVNAAAYTAVDKAEDDEAEAYRVNAIGAQNLAIAASEKDIPILHISTDYVFDGDAALAYRENDRTNPQGAYGRTKLAGENLVAEANPKHLILRTSWVFGIQGNNFVKTMLRLGSERDELSVVADQSGCPTFAGHIAAALLDICQLYQSGAEIKWGVYHFSDAGITTWHQFASDIIQQGYDAGLIEELPKIQPISTENYPTPAKRPLYSCLDHSLFESNFPTIKIKKWEDGLEELISSIKK